MVIGHLHLVAILLHLAIITTSVGNFFNDLWIDDSNRYCIFASSTVVMQKSHSKLPGHLARIIFRRNVDGECRALLLRVATTR